MILDQFNLRGKVALVTGCKRGIGAAMTLALAEAGADIIGVSANLELAGSKVGDAVAALGRKFTPYRCDFSHRDLVEEFVGIIKEHHPVVDILVPAPSSAPRPPSMAMRCGTRSSRSISVRHSSWRGNLAAR
jgi:2-deoxy-D-gluconate 3-dehydrogenase